ncbi:hypothetical protein FSARC_6690 [Fusarium sarcochroum]|uniref:Uncharacterized protein n=1 Tax=Fusarium sarcochroum TaxID=1208366 RepID=A0A8H4X8R1_9HYPO|nr:hypothetical protein FSARC_6690 [Fusarium sarcochroum]
MFGRIITRNQIHKKSSLQPEDYDEDISDLESEQSCSSENGCEYDSNEDCTKHDGFEPESDDSSDSDGGSDIDGYYQMKRERKKRKEELKEQKEYRDDNLSEDLEFETRYENQVKEVLAKLQASKKKPSPLKRIGGRMFKIWSVDHVKHCPPEVAPTRYIEFYSDDEYDEDKCDRPERKQKQLGGHIYLISETIGYLHRFIPPKLPSTKPYQLRVGDSTLDVQFIDDNYMILKIPRELVFINVKTPIPSEAPPVFTYYGICDGHMVEESKRRQEKKERRRSASPE